MTWATTIHALDEPTAQARWQALWEESPQRSSFSSLAYVRAAAEAYGLESEMVLVSAEGRDEAGALLLWRQRGPYRVIVIPPFTQYSALILRTAPTEAEVHARQSAFEAMLSALESRFSVLRFFVSLSDVRPAQWRGWSARLYYTYLLSLGTQETVLQRWSSSRRRLFRKHAPAYHVEEDVEAASTIIAHCEASYQRHERTLPAPQSQILHLLSLLQAQGLIRLFTATAKDQDTPDGGLAVLHDGQTAHYWIAGSAPGPAMTVLLGHALPRLYEDGLQQFDFVGANTPSIAEFKRPFGPVLTPYMYLDQCSRPELRLYYRLKGA